MDHKFYTKKDISDVYRKLGVSRGRTVYVTSDLGRLMAYENPDKTSLMADHLEIISDLIGADGTVVAPSSSMNLCNTDTPFDLVKTPSYKIGAFSEYIRQHPGSLRSFHPFVSYSAIGADAKAITENVSRHAFGPETPEARMIEADALCLVIARLPRLTCSTVHHIEMIMGVPYRYNKEYTHPVVRKGCVEHEYFYQNVWYRDVDLKRNLNRNIFERFTDTYTLNEQPLGRNSTYSYSVLDFATHCQKMFAEDIYVWCDEPPKSRPYRV